MEADAIENRPKLGHHESDACLARFMSDAMVAPEPQILSIILTISV